MAARARSPSWTSAPSRGVSRGRGVAAWPGAAGSSPAPTKGNLMFPTVIGRWLVCAIGAPLLASPAALAAAPHRVLPGETLWSISAANNLTTRTFEAEPATTAIVPAPGMGHVPSPYGELHLSPAAADAWNAMRAEASTVYGIDIYPGGPASAYRTYAQQSQLYGAFLAGQGAPANPPGTSSHESGTAVDLQTPDMRWVIDQIGSRYGWGKIHAPGEWWHVDYLGG